MCNFYCEGATELLFYVYHIERRPRLFGHASPPFCPKSAKSMAFALKNCPRVLYVFYWQKGLKLLLYIYRVKWNDFYLRKSNKDMLIQTEASSNHAKRLFECIIVFSKGTSLCFQICLIFPRWETTRVEVAWNGLPLTRNPF